MHRLLVLWAVPRSTSTAFEWMMRQRGDMTCFHEPFGEAWYFGETPLWPDATEDSRRTPGLSLESVWRELKETAVEGPVFTKDFPYYVDHMWDDDFLNSFTHSFLIRDPGKSLPSFHKLMPKFTLKEGGLPDQRALFDLLWERVGRPPPVIDSDDLLTDPFAVTEAYCEAVGIPFLPDALNWSPGPRDEVSWWHEGAAHENLRNSGRLQHQSRPADISKLPVRVREIYQDSLPHYQHMYAHRLTGRSAC